MGGGPSVLSLSSMSSTASSSYAFNKIIKDFKKALGKRTTPKSLILLNRLLVGLLLCIIVIISIDFSMKKDSIELYDHLSMHALMAKSRSIGYIMLVSNFRSLINIAN